MNGALLLPTAGALPLTFLPGTAEGGDAVASNVYTEVLDFSRSFLTFRIDALKRPPITASHKPPYSLNNARIQLDCRCTVTESATGESQTYVLGASCKTERVGVESDIWTQPNADFIPILSDTHFMHLKTYARCGLDVELFGHDGRRQPDRQHGLVSDAFDDLRIDLIELEAVELNSPREIVEATLDNRLLVARTTIETDRYSALIEYPVKTMNANERDWIYQTDTGPVLLPDLTRNADEMIQGFELAFSAFNCFEWCEFIVRIPTPISDGVNVQHYSRSHRVDCRNQVFAI